MTSQLTALFDPNGPCGFRCFAVLDGLQPGRILTDDPVHPTWGIVWEAGDGTLYPGGALDGSILRDAVTTLRQEGDVLVGFWEGDPLRELLPPDPQYTGTVLEFLDRPGHASGLDAWLAPLPVGYELRPITRELLEECIWYEGTVRRHGGADRFLETGLGMCLLHNGLVVSEAYASPRVLGTRELGAITREGYRGRGLATITCAQLIAACERLGDATYWNCASTNLASAAVARKMGYQIEREYQLVAWFRSD